MLGSLLGAFPGAIQGAAIPAMASFQVKQSEQAAVQAAFMLVGSIAQMFAPLYYYVRIRTLPARPKYTAPVVLSSSALSHRIDIYLTPVD